MIARVAGWARAGLPPRAARSSAARLVAGHVNGAAVAGAMAICAAYYARHAPLAAADWAHWFDQSMYVQAARAWAAGDVDPARHWYLPGYPLLGAAFARSFPAQPFWAPDLLCLLASAWLCGALAALLQPGWAGARGAGSLVFAATIAASPLLREAWVVPWSTTPTVPLTLAALVAALRFDARPARGTAALAGLAAASVALFRPTDALALLATVPPFIGWRVLAGWPGASRGAAMAGAAAGGAGLAAAVLLGAHTMVHGASLGPYLTASARVGFEWRRVPLQWVTLFLGPQPMFATRTASGALGGAGMVAVFAWIMPGLAGIGACLAAPDGLRRRHVLVAAVVALDVGLYLAYRDLHPDGLWRYGNYHYFKFVLPVFALYSMFLLRALARRETRWRAVAGAAACALPLLCWRAALVPVGQGVAGGQPDRATLDRGLAPIGTAVALAAAGRFEAIYLGNMRLEAAGRPVALNNDFKAIPVQGGLLAVPLRPLAPVPSVLTAGDGVRFDPAVPPVLLRQTVRFGLPCVVPALLPSCEVPRFLPGPALPAGQVIAFGEQELPYLREGWSDAERTGRWTDGTRVRLLLRPQGLRPGADAVLRLRARAFLPRGGTMRVAVSAGEAALTTWVFEGQAEEEVAVRVPAAALDADGTLALVLAPDRPAWSPDGRRLGLFVTSMRLD